MRIERIVARAFGPFRGEELDLAPGMTVVAGPNEAGKSTWHAALRLALTGVRRGKGPGTAAERQMSERHKPWDLEDRWEVEARIRLADGRRIELRQDLAGKVDCRAVDIELGRDVSAEILDGTPDASRWLGLDRETFASTVAVSQAQMLAVTDAADQLQEAMQRAAATHGADATAAEAIERLEQFRRDAVGVDRVGARGPLRMAKDRMAAAEGRLDDVRRQHEEYLDRSASFEAVERRVEEARRASLRAEAGRLAARAADARRRHTLAAELAERHPAPPQASMARDERADAVASALDAWANRPAPVSLAGVSVADLERELSALPPLPEGDLEIHPAVREAARALDLADAALATLGEEDEDASAEPDLPAVEEGQVRDLARRLRVPQLPGVAPLESELAAARAAAAAVAAPGRWPVLLAVAAAVAAGLLLVVGSLLPGIVAGLAAALLGGWSWIAGAARRLADRRVARAEAALAPFAAATAAAERERSDAEAAARGLGLEPQPRALDELADRLAARAAVRRLASDRQARLGSLSARRDAAVAALRAALAERSEQVGEDPSAALAAYEERCRRRAEQATAASRRESLERQIEARRAAEQSAAATLASVATAEERLRQAAAAVEVPADGSPDEVSARLRAWQQSRAQRVRETQQAVAEWERLQSLLDGRTLEQLRVAADNEEHELARLRAQLDEDVPAPQAPVEELERRAAMAREELMRVSGEAEALTGNLQARRDALPDVAEAEEAVLSARAELERVLALAATLDATLRLLRAAEERVHRNLAPVLAGAIVQWLPGVSGGAYSEVTVDPADLAVRVKEAATGKWRDARLLSEGTREQIYLLLRVAMAQHLVARDEVAPLLLDEVTAQSDSRRKEQLLSVLHRLSAERQVILFTHDDEVVEWADANLDLQRDALVRLAPRASRSAALPVHDATATASPAG